MDLAIVSMAVLAIAGTVKLVWREFTFFGDNAESFFPLWHIYGTALRSGGPALFDPDGWGAGNMVGEAAYGLFNPVTALNALFISLTDRMSLAGFVVIVEFLLILAWGVYMLARSYGSTRAASMVGAVIAPFAGYTLFYEAGNWASGLMSATWVVHFWWALRTYAGGRIGPLLPFIFGFLAATVGNPYSVVGILVVLVSVGGEALLLRHFRRFGGLVLVGLAVGTSVILTYAPLLAVLSQIDRPVDGELVANTNYLTPSLSDLLGMSSGSYLPRITAWYGVHDLVPSTYLSWLILPILPWVRWRDQAKWLPASSLLIATLIFVILTLGPDQLWLFRWPIRFVEYLFLAVLVIFTMLISPGLATDRKVRRAAFSLFAVGVSLYLSWASTPHLSSTHLLFAAVTLVLAAALYFAYRYGGVRGILVLTVLGTLLITPMQAANFAWSKQDVSPGVNQRPPGDLAVVRDAWASIDGRVLQIAELDELEGTDAVATGQLVFGNVGAAAGIDILNRYTGINFQRFKDGLAFDYRGTVGSWFPLSFLWTPVSDEHPVNVVDALGIDTLVIAAGRHDAGEADELAREHGWRVTERGDLRIVLEREAPLTHPVISADADIMVTDAKESPYEVRFTVDADRGGSVLLDRVAWNGYTASLNEEPLEVRTAPYGLLEIVLPPQAAGTVTVSYSPPGLALGLWVAAAGLILAVGHQIVWWRRRPQSVSDPALNLADEREDPSNFVI